LHRGGERSLLAHSDCQVGRAADECVRGEAIAALAGARTAEAIVPAIEPDDRYSGIARDEATDVAASRCRRSNGATQGGRGRKAIVEHSADAAQVPTSRNYRQGAVPAAQLHGNEKRAAATPAASRCARRAFSLKT
jgi:hypothetical protein